MKKLAIFFPGIGYTNDKPLLYYSRKIAKEKGYEEICVEYSNLPKNVKGDKEKMKESLLLAYKQSCDELIKIDFSEYDEILIVGKSLGTVVAAKFHEEHCQAAKLVLYTPVEATFGFKINDAIAFIGDNDSWSNLDDVKRLSQMAGVPLNIYSDCNHSLEVDNNYEVNINNLKNVMDLTFEYIK